MFAVYGAQRCGCEESNGIDQKNKLKIIRLVCEQNRIEQYKTEQSKIDQNSTKQNRVRQIRIVQNRIEQNSTEQNRVEQSRIVQNRIEEKKLMKGDRKNDFHDHATSQIIPSHYF